MTHPDWHIPDPDMQPAFYQDLLMKRGLAWLADTVAVILLCLLILPFTFFTGIFFFPLLMLVVGFVYRVITIAQGSATPGMRLMAIEFRTLKGERFDMQTAFMHTAVFTFCCAIVLAQIGSIILMAMSPRAQGLPDHLLGTVALNRRAGS